MLVAFFVVVVLCFGFVSDVKAWGNDDQWKAELARGVAGVIINGQNARVRRAEVQGMVQVQTMYGLAWMKQADANAYATRRRADADFAYDAEVGRALREGRPVYRSSGSSADGDVYSNSAVDASGGYYNSGNGNRRGGRRQMPMQMMGGGFGGGDIYGAPHGLNQLPAWLTPAP